MINLLLLCMIGADYYEPEYILVEEEVDEIIIVDEIDSDYDRVVFVKNGKFLCDRMLLDEMLWSLNKEGFVLEWDDYGQYRRRVTAKKCQEWVVEEYPFRQDGPWFAQWRVMSDLKCP